MVIRSSTGPTSTVVKANTSSAENVTVFTISACNNITIQGLNITGAGPGHSGVYLQGSTNCKIKDNILHDDTLGIDLENSHYSVINNNTATYNLAGGERRGINIERSNYTTVSNNRISNSKYGIYIYIARANTLSGNTVNLSSSNGIHLEDATNITITNNNVNSSAVYGIFLSRSNGNFLRSNTLFNNSNNGFEIINCAGNEISSNAVSDDAIATNTHGIHLNTTQSCTVRNNVISNNEYGIAIIYSTNDSVVNNTAYNNSRGIYLAYTSSLNTLANNQANSNVNSGIVLQNANSNTLFNNTARSNIGIANSNGIALGGSNNNNLTGNIVSGNRRGIYADTSSSGNKFSGNTISSNTGTGILLENAGSDNNITSNNVSSNGGIGIALASSSNTYVLNNVVLRNARGIEASISNETVISNNTASNNAGSGIRLSISNNNTVSGNTAFDDTYGIEMNSSTYNNISSNNITKCTTNGLFLCAASKHNLIYNNYLNNTENTDNNNNESTWNIANTSGTNIAGGYYLGGNFWGDPLLKDDHSQTEADANGDGFTDTIYSYDGVVDNLPLVTVYRVLPSADFTTNVSSGNVPLTVQFTDHSQNATGWSWNFGDGNTSDVRNTTHTYSAVGNHTVTLTARNVNGTATKTAIISVMQQQGGNGSTILPDASFTANVTSGYYPLTVLFTDTSQNSTSRSWDVNGDGVADSTDASFAYTYGSSGDYTARLTASNANGTDTASTIISVERRSSGGSSGGGGGGGGSPEPAKNVQVKELAQTFVTSGKAIKFDFSKNATCVVYVNFDSKKTAGKTTTIAEQLKNKSTLTSGLPNGEVYRYFNVWVGNSGFATSSNIDNPGICFKVEKSWLQDKKVDKNSITLNRYSNKAWEELPVSLLKEDSKYQYFTANVSGYSFFAITGKSSASSGETTHIKPQNESDNTGDNMGDTGSEADTEPATEENKDSPGFGMICGIVGLSVAFMYRRK